MGVDGGGARFATIPPTTNPAGGGRRHAIDVVVLPLPSIGSAGGSKAGVVVRRRSRCCKPTTATLFVILALCLVAVATVQFSLHRRAASAAFVVLPAPSSDETRAVSERQRTTHYSVVNDGLLWISPKPDSARRVGWEDEWMMDWKRRRYDDRSREHGTTCRCDATDRTPYDDDLLCTIPGYVPARLLPPPPLREDVERPAGGGGGVIPRVIFVSWFDRRLGRSMYTSLLTVLHHNPEYEFVFFDDDDVDRFLCDNYAEDFVPLYSRVNAQAGAMRTDIWRLLVIQRYGGVYLDSDVSALGKLPIEGGHDAAVSGTGCWSHLPSGTGGLLEHWAMAFAPRHPFVNEAVAVVKSNLERPEYLTREGTPEAEAEDSWTMRLTGPAMYQWVLHGILEKAGCRKEDNSYCEALWSPETYCSDVDTFRSFFPGGLRALPRLNMNDALSHKMFYPADAWELETSKQFDFGDYDDPALRMAEGEKGDPGFCDADAFARRAEGRERRWERRVEDKDS